MSQFLGRQDCIESLRKDLVDLQGSIVDVLSRTGPVRFSSWKFPDKLSCNLDMVGLLEQYDYVDGEDAFNQHSHIVLLELVIDRLLLLLQSFNSYVEQLRCRNRREEPHQTGSQSVGLAVRNYWSNLDQLSNCKTEASTLEGDDREKTLSPQISSRNDCCRHCSAAWPQTSSSTLLPVSEESSSPSPKESIRSVGCQTLESSLIPCDACHGVQSVLKKTGDALVELLRGEGLPCSLQPLLSAVEDTVEAGGMTAGDVAQWSDEQLRDMRRLAKHLHDVRGTVQPLKDRLAAAEMEQKTLRAQLEKAQREMEKHQATIVQLEFSLSKAQRSVKETERKLQEEQQQLNREMMSLEESKSMLGEKVAQQQNSLQELECEKMDLQEKVKTLQRLEEEARSELQQRVQQLESEISETQVLLDKEKAKFQSACRQQESMQAKQKALLQRVDALDEDCEDLQRQLGESEQRELDLLSQLRQMTIDTEQQQIQLQTEQDLGAQLRSEKQILETHLGDLKTSVAELKEHVAALQEREKLLVAFPELSPLAQAQPQTTGNVLLDMEQQLRANSIRIKVLEQENTTLHSSLEKLREHNAARGGSPQQPWSLSLPNTPKQTLLYAVCPEIPQSSREEPKEAEGSRLESAGSSDRVPAATSTPLSVQVHLQTLHINTGPAAAKSQAKTQSQAPDWQRGLQQICWD